MDRTDKKKLPLSFFPGGTGNAFVRDIDFLDTKKALSRTLENKKRKIDIFLCKTQKKQFYSFNIVGWGIPSDINILAEKLRFLGGMRYNVASLIEYNFSIFAYVDLGEMLKIFLVTKGISL